MLSGVIIAWVKTLLEGADALSKLQAWGIGVVLSRVNLLIGWELSPLQAGEVVLSFSLAMLALSHACSAA